MLWHVISPSYGYVKAAHHIVRHPKLDSDAKILITYVQGLPEKRAGKALSDHAKALGITGRAYQRAKSQLKENGFVHEWRRQNEGGLWVTDQLFSNVMLTDEEARRLRDTGPENQPSEQSPTVGRPGGRLAGGYKPEVEEREKNSSHPPSEPPAAEPAAEPGPPDPEVVEAERVLLSLRHASPQLHLGVREARSLSGAAADWLRRGVKAAELRLALVSELPADGVRSAFGFVRHRLVQKLPEEPAPVVRAPEVRPVVPCEGEGPEHVFRPRAGETVCRSCAQGAAEAAHWAKWPRSRPDDGFEEEHGPLPWRERVAAILEKDAAQDAGRP